MELDFPAVDPKHVQVVFENPRVRVLKVTIESFDRTQRHFHPAGVGVYLTDHDLRNTDDQGRVTEVRGQAGEAKWIDPVTHVTENLSSRHVELIFVQVKS